MILSFIGGRMRQKVNGEWVPYVPTPEEAVRDEEKFADMVQSRQPPGARGTDRAFLEGGQSQFDSMCKENREYILNSAKQAGINIAGKRYVSGIGKPNDPAAWVSSASDVLAVARKRHLKITGAVNYDPGPPMPPQKVALSEEIIREEAQHRMKENPALAEKVKKSKKAKRELREAIVAKHATKQKG